MLNIHSTDEMVAFIAYAVFVLLAVLYFVLWILHMDKKLPEWAMTMLDPLYIRGKEKRRQERGYRRRAAVRRRKFRKQFRREVDELHMTREEHLKERYAIIMHTRELRLQLEDKAFGLIGRLEEEGRLTEEECRFLENVIEVEGGKMWSELRHHENLYPGISEEGDKVIQEISDEEMRML